MAYLSLLTALPVLSFVAWWTGRWYKEWFFAQFNIPTEALGFDVQYYVFASWTVLLLALCGLAIPTNVLAATLALRSYRTFVTWIWLMLALLILVFSVVLLINAARRGSSFDPTSSVWLRFKSSLDLVLISLGGCSLILLSVGVDLGWSDRMATAGSAVVKRFPSVFIVALVLGVWAYLAVTAYALGRYHGQSAIWSGKMGLRWAKARGEWWILVVTARDGRNFLFDRTTQRIIVVKSEDIEEIDGPVTQSTKGLPSGVK